MKKLGLNFLSLFTALIFFAPVSAQTLEELQEKMTSLKHVNNHSKTLTAILLY
jgi:hypothetical protein